MLLASRFLQGGFAGDGCLDRQRRTTGAGLAKQARCDRHLDNDTAVLVMLTMVLRITLLVLLVGGGFQTVATMQLKRNHHKGHSVLNS